MGYSLGGPDRHGRFIGYGVPAFCDHPDCDAEIDRGFSYLCAAKDLYGGENGCGLAFCEKHQNYVDDDRPQACERCAKGKDHFTPKPEHPVWLRHLLNDESWGKWRQENPSRVKQLRVELAKQGDFKAKPLSKRERDLPTKTEQEQHDRIMRSLGEQPASSENP